MTNFDGNTLTDSKQTTDSSGYLYIQPKATGYYTTNSKFKIQLESLLASGLLDTIKETKQIDAPLYTDATVSPSSGKLLSSVVVKAVPAYTMEVTAGTATKTVDVTTNKKADKVKVNPTPSQSKTQRAPISGTTTVTPDTGNLLSSVVIQAPETQSKTGNISGTDTSCTVTPDTSKLLTSVTVTCDRPHESHAVSSVETQTIQAGQSVTITQNTFALNDIVLTAEGDSTIIQAVNDRGGTLPDNATKTDIVNAIKNLNLTVLGDVTYEYHYHDKNSACYVPAKKCPGSGTNAHTSASNSDYYDGVCDTCGRSLCWKKDGGDSHCSKIIKAAYYNCGYTNGAIVKATITY